MNKPKNRRSTWRYFHGCDILKFDGEWFIRLPNEREHHHLTFEQMNAISAEATAAAEVMKKNQVRITTKRGPDTVTIGMVDPDPGLLLRRITALARSLLNLNGPDQETSR